LLEIKRTTIQGKLGDRVIHIESKKVNESVIHPLNEKETPNNRTNRSYFIFLLLFTCKEAVKLSILSGWGASGTVTVSDEAAATTAFCWCAAGRMLVICADREWKGNVEGWGKPRSMQRIKKSTKTTQKLVVRLVTLDFKYFDAFP
jgi:hypothetical protein